LIFKENKRKQKEEIGKRDSGAPPPIRISGYATVDVDVFNVLREEYENYAVHKYPGKHLTW